MEKKKNSNSQPNFPHKLATANRLSFSSINYNYLFTTYLWMLLNFLANEPA